jgi:hypothetical protein
MMQQSAALPKEQRAMVVGCQSAIGPEQQTVLDTLFVRLSNAPKSINIE